LTWRNLRLIQAGHHGGMSFIRALWPIGLVWVLQALTGQAVAQPAPNAATDDALPALLQRALALENGEGVTRNPLLAAQLYCQGAMLGDERAQYNLGWMYANGRGVARDDATAAYFFQAAARQGLAAAQRMLAVVGQPGPDTPACMRLSEPAPEAQPAPTALAPTAAIVAKPAVNFAKVAPRQVLELVVKLAPQFQVEPQLALAIIALESNFDSQALSPKNAQGLMQLIPQTSERFQVRNAFDPAQNIRGGLSYLRWLLAYFEGDIALVAAAYNAGEGAVERHRGVPPYQETRAYVQRILRAMGTTLHAFDPKITPPSPLLRKLAVTWKTP
jgi:soluble lytic murein transglycosylase-like protein